MAPADDDWLEYAHQVMQRAGLRAGAARSGLLEQLARDGECLVAAQTLASELRSTETASAASVYRVLDELERLGLVARVTGADGTARFERRSRDGRSHHHFVDDATGEIVPFEDAALDAAISAAAARLGAELSARDVILRGRRRIEPPVS